MSHSCCCKFWLLHCTSSSFRMRWQCFITPFWRLTFGSCDAMFIVGDESRWSKICEKIYISAISWEFRWRFKGHDTNARCFYMLIPLLPSSGYSNYTTQLALISIPQLFTPHRWNLIQLRLKFASLTMVTRKCVCNSILSPPGFKLVKWDRCRVKRWFSHSIWRKHFFPWESPHLTFFASLKLTNPHFRHKLFPPFLAQFFFVIAAEKISILACNLSHSLTRAVDRS